MIARFYEFEMMHPSEAIIVNAGLARDGYVDRRNAGKLLPWLDWPNVRISTRKRIIDDVRLISVATAVHHVIPAALLLISACLSCGRLRASAHAAVAAVSRCCIDRSASRNQKSLML